MKRRTQLIIIFSIGFLISCSKNVKEVRDYNIVQHESGVWNVDSLAVPNCGTCEGMDLNLLFGKQVNVNDKLVMTPEKLFHLTSIGDTLSINSYRIDNEIFEIFGSDWVSYATVVEKNEDEMKLISLQQVSYPIGQEPPSNELQIYLKKEK
jgi:hypothetical protein